MNKRGIGALLIELIIAVVIFFLILMIPSLIVQAGYGPQPQAHAMIKTVGDTELCNNNLLNIIRGQSTQVDGTIGDAIILDYLAGKDDYSKNQINILLTNMFESRPWSFSINAIGEERYNLSNGDMENQLSCITYLPIPAPHANNCEFSEAITLDADDRNNDSYEFITPDEIFTVELVNTECIDDSAGTCQFGVVLNPPDIIEQKYGLYEQITSMVAESADSDTLMLPLALGDNNVSYTLRIMEQYADTDYAYDINAATLAITRDNDVRNCGILLNLTINQYLE